MPYQGMKFAKSELSGPKPVKPGQYTVRLKGFKQKLAKSGDSLNLNPQVEIIEPAEYSDVKLSQYLWNLNTQIPGFIQDFVHSFGLEMEDDGEDNLKMPGDFDGDADIEKAKYVGPLLGRVATWELGIRTYDGKEQNEVVKCICAVPDCAERNPDVRHSKDMRQKSK